MIYPLKHLNYVCLSIYVIHCSLNKIKLEFDAQCKIISLFTCLICGLGLGLDFGLENAGPVRSPSGQDRQTNERARPVMRPVNNDRFNIAMCRREF